MRKFQIGILGFVLKNVKKGFKKSDIFLTEYLVYIQNKDINYFRLLSPHKGLAAIEIMKNCVEKKRFCVCESALVIKFNNLPMLKFL